jgi:hypothetical protein
MAISLNRVKSIGTVEDSNVLLDDNLRMRQLYKSAKSAISFDDWVRPRRANPLEFNR